MVRVVPLVYKLVRAVQLALVSAPEPAECQPEVALRLDDRAAAEPEVCLYVIGTPPQGDRRAVLTERGEPVGVWSVASFTTKTRGLTWTDYVELGRVYDPMVFDAVLQTDPDDAGFIAAARPRKVPAAGGRELGERLQRPEGRPFGLVLDVMFLPPVGQPVPVVLSWPQCVMFDCTDQGQGVMRIELRASNGRPGLEPAR